MNGVMVKRKMKNMSQQQLADAVGVSQSTVAMWETGKRIPRGKMLKLLANSLGCTIDELFAGDGKGVSK